MEREREREGEREREKEREWARTRQKRDSTSISNLLSQYTNNPAHPSTPIHSRSTKNHVRDEATLLEMRRRSSVSLLTSAFCRLTMSLSLELYGYKINRVIQVFPYHSYLCSNVWTNKHKLPSQYINLLVIISNMVKMSLRLLCYFCPVISVFWNIILFRFVNIQFLGSSHAGSIFKAISSNEVWFSMYSSLELKKASSCLKLNERYRVSLRKTLKTTFFDKDKHLFKASSLPRPLEKN